MAAAVLLPNAMTQFSDANGVPYANGQVFTYVPATTTPKTTWQDIGETTPNTNPIILDAAGRAQIWGDGYYRQQLYDQLGTLVWDQPALALSMSYILSALPSFTGDSGIGGSAGLVPAPPATSAVEGFYLSANGVWQPLEVVIPAEPTANQAGFLGAPQNVITTNYSLQITDCGGNIYHNNASAHSITVVADANINWPVNCKTLISIDNPVGSGVLSLVPDTGVTLLGPGLFPVSGTRSVAANGAVVLSRVAANTWTVQGAGLS